MPELLDPSDARARLPALLPAACAGDRVALRAVYQMQARRLFGIADAVLRDPDAAADALQDAFLRIAGGAERFDHARDLAAADWLADVVRRSALDLARRRGREEPIGDSASPDGHAVAPQALARLAATAAGERVLECLQTLPEGQRRCVLLAHVHGLSHAQVADRMALPPGTAKAWIRRGLIRLKDCLG